MAGSRDPSNQVFGNRSHAFLFNRLLRRTERHNLYNTIMKKLFIGLLFGVGISQFSMGQTYTVRVYDMTPKYATYTPLETPAVKLPETKTKTYADYLEEELRIKRLQAELRELDRRQTANTNTTTVNNSSNTKQTKAPEIIKGYQYKNSAWIPISLKVIKENSDVMLLGVKEQDKQWVNIQPVTSREFIDNKLYSHYIDFEEGRVCFKY